MRECRVRWQTGYWDSVGCPPLGRSRVWRREPFGEIGEGHRVAVLDATVGPFEQLEGHVADADGSQGVAERLAPDLKEPLVTGAAVDPEGPQAPEGIRMAGHHTHRVPVEPPRPDILVQYPVMRVER